MKFGFSFQDQNANGFGQQDISGRADFSYQSTGVPGGTTPASGGNAFASFLLGDAILGRTETIRYVNQNYPYHGFYAQDDWRITRKLTLNYGLRYEFTLPPISGTDEYSDFNPTRPNPGADGYPGALMFAGFGPGRENKRSLGAGLVWRHGVRASASRMRPTTRARSAPRSDDPSAASRRCREAATLPASSASTSSTTRTTADADLQLGSGLAGVQAAALDRSRVLERQYRRLVAGTGSRARAGESVLDLLHAAGSRCTTRFSGSRTTRMSERICRPAC